MAKHGRTTEELGLGWRHRQQRERLLAQHIDGSPCPCLMTNDCGPSCLCRPHGVGQPMYRDRHRNPDGLVLEADHSEARSLGGTLADRLMLATCNRSRGNGTRFVEYRRDSWSRDWLAGDVTFRRRIPTR